MITTIEFFFYRICTMEINPIYIIDYYTVNCKFIGNIFSFKTYEDGREFCNSFITLFEKLCYILGNINKHPEELYTIGYQELMRMFPSCQDSRLIINSNLTNSIIPQECIILSFNRIYKSGEFLSKKYIRYCYDRYISHHRITQEFITGFNNQFEIHYETTLKQWYLNCDEHYEKVYTIFKTIGRNMAFNQIKRLDNAVNQCMNEQLNN